MRADDGADYLPKLTKKFTEQARKNNAARARERELVGKLGRALEEKMEEILDHAIDVFFQKYEEQFGKIALQTTPGTEPIRAHRRKKEIMLARQAVMYWAVRLTGYSYPKIGRIMGERDHTTIMNGATAYRQKREKMGRYLRKAR